MSEAEKLDIAERRARYWKATAIRAAKQELPFGEVMVRAIANIWNAPSLSEIENEERLAVSGLTHFHNGGTW